MFHRVRVLRGPRCPTGSWDLRDQRGADDGARLGTERSLGDDSVRPQGREPVTAETLHDLGQYRDA